MRDITTEIKKAITSSNLWSISIFDEFIKELEKHIQVSYWENEENWASILNDELKVKGFVWKKYPLIVVEKGLDVTIITELDKEQKISLLILDSLNEENLTIREDFIQLSHYKNNEFDFDSFTMEDMWFYTNSI